MSDDTPTDKELAWAGKVWDAALRRDCAAFYWTTFGNIDAANAFDMCTWEDIGRFNQIEIAKALLRLEGYFVRAHR
jgi:hypothetical protein